jgi:hypothetical protein
MAKIAGLQYVNEFTFPTEQGFTGSAGKENVRGYYRGGRVKKDPVKAAAQKPRAAGPGASHGGEVKAGARRKASGAGMPKNVKARGGKMEYNEGGTVGVTTPRRGKSMPQQGKQEHYAAKSAAKNRGGMMDYAEGGSVHDKLKAEGAKMGYAYGGTVKNTSAEFVQTSGKQATMDNANYPPGHPSSARDKESGPRKKLRPRFKKGGGVRHVRDAGYADGGAIKVDLSKIKGAKTRESGDAKGRRKASKKGMPKGVKAHGGLAKYAAGGYAEGGTKKGEEAGSGIELTIRNIQEQISDTEDLLQEAAAASKIMTTSGTTAARATRSRSLDDPEFQVTTPSAATEAAKAASKPEPSIKQTGVGKSGEPAFGREMKPVMHAKLAGGGVVSAAKGGKKKAARRARGGRR